MSLGGFDYFFKIIFVYWCLPACKSVHQVHAVPEVHQVHAVPGIPEESIRAPGTEVTVASCLVGARN